ncbi:eukaryotic translation initiation factor 2A [Macrosteles quadrilineatus]|uniref:eukaryotic translation initiation factor 2A n=1 Tax=Macrosteles quadrilineatus TaxID=74068 RepID=UPI0023E20DA4|nr:eukaryotic translation initiation factor 2A [Macrosteles quadrilineatus]
MASAVPVVAVRGSTGISVNQGPPSYELVSAFKRDDSKNCRCMLFSPHGEYFAWANGININIVATKTWTPLASIPSPKTYCIQFSPRGTYLMTWQPFIVSNANPQGGPNMFIYKSDTGDLVASFVHKKQTDWEPQWSADESLCLHTVNHEVVCYAATQLDKPAHRLTGQKVVSVSLSSGNPPFHLLCYVPGKPGQPSFIKLYQYPKFDTPVASKTFFQSDKVEMWWNKKGTGALVMASMEVDKTGSSYYGKQSLHFVSVKGDTAMVLLGKEGPIYAVSWSPLGTEFCVVYGFMPAKATLYNLKCEAVFNLGSGSRNSIYYNPHGNILLLGGFGNLSGQIEVWDTTSRKLISKLESPDTTLLHWSPDGEHFMTATTAPRLRMGNGFKIWHYSGALLYERPWNKQEELWEVLWQNFPTGVFRTPAITSKPVEGIQPSQPTASKQAYRPPSARGKEINFKLHDDEDVPTLVSETASNPSKAALKLKKKREAKKAARQQAAELGEVTNNSNGVPPIHKPSILSEEVHTDDPEKLKKIKKLKSKLLEISRLKEQKANGKALEINQVEKLKKEDQLIKELQELCL